MKRGVACVALLSALVAGCGGDAASSGGARPSDGSTPAAEGTPGGAGDATPNPGVFDRGASEPAVPASTVPIASDGASASLVACNPLSEWRRGDIATPARVEARGSIAPLGEEVLVVGSQSGGSDSDLRLFMGTPPQLSERRIVSRERTPTPPQDHRLSVELGAGTLAELILPALYPGDDDTVPKGLGTLILPSESFSVDSLPRTALSIAGQRFECLPSDADAWQLSNEPTAHAPAASCAAEDVPDLHCFSLFQGSDSPDAAIGEQDFQVSVAAMGVGAPPLDITGGCYQRFQFFDSDYPGQPLVWATLARGPELGFIAFRSPGVPLPFAEGDTLLLEYATNPWLFREALTVRSADGALLLWSTRGTDVDSLNPPVEVEIARGAEECPATSGCYFTSQYAYDITFAGERHQVSFAQQTPLPGYVFVNIGLELPTAQIPSCLDGDAGRAWAELWALPAD